MAKDRRRASRCGRICEICDVEAAPSGVYWAESTLTRITLKQYQALSNHEQWLRGRAADISRRAWRRSAAYRNCKPRRSEGPGGCAICNIAPAYTIDHVWPLVLGGTHDDSNLQFACYSCNSRKGVKV